MNAVIVLIFAFVAAATAFVPYHQNIHVATDSVLGHGLYDYPSGVGSYSGYYPHWWSSPLSHVWGSSYYPYHGLYHGSYGYDYPYYYKHGYGYPYHGISSWYPFWHTYGHNYPVVY